MEQINIHNYEAFLLDYLEGNLSDELCSELKLFAITHPELEIDLEDQNLPTFKAEQVDADFKMHLKKTELNFPDEELINAIENNLSEAEQKALESKLLNDKELASDLAQYKKTLLPLDPSFIFENKNSLLKTEDELILNNRVISYFENALPASEKAEFESELKTNITLQKDFELVSKTRLNLDASIVYPNKEELKKETKVIVLFSFRAVGAMAAAILLLFVLGFVFNYYTSGTETRTDLAKKESPKIDLNREPNNKPLPGSLNTVDRVELNKEKVIAQGKKVKPANNIKTSPESNPAPQISNQVAENKEIKNNEQLETNEPGKNLAVENKTVKPVVTNPDPVMQDTIDARQTVVNVLEESEDDGEDKDESKNGFWKKAVKLAKRANRLGVKSVDGVEKPNETFALSFNAFSVERH